MEYLLSVEVEHALRSHIMLSAGAEYLIEYCPWLYDGDRTMTVTMSVEYFFSRSVTLAAAYKIQDYAAIDPEFDCKANQFTVGLRLRQQ